MFAIFSQAQNDDFSVIFNLEDYKSSREKSYKQIEAAIAKFREIKDNINEGLKFYVTLQDAITNVKQQSNDFVMTRNIQCREMIEDVQRQVAGLSFQDKNTGGYNNYPSVGNQNQRSNTQTDPRPQAPYYQQPEQPPAPAYGQAPPPYGSAHHQSPPPYQIPPTSASPYPPPQ
ncbi:ALG-2 interacting protein X-like, partial [Trifolium medium]|nr:ALG-2 interacting protein X-like [Trifolium medium]